MTSLNLRKLRLERLPMPGDHFNNFIVFRRLEYDKLLYLGL